MGKREIHKTCRHRQQHRLIMDNSHHRLTHRQWRRIQASRAHLNRKDNQLALRPWHTTLQHRLLQSRLLIEKRLRLQWMPLMGLALLQLQWQIMCLDMA